MTREFEPLPILTVEEEMTFRMNDILNGCEWEATSSIESRAFYFENPRGRAVTLLQNRHLDMPERINNRALVHSVHKQSLVNIANVCWISDSNELTIGPSDQIDYLERILSQAKSRIEAQGSEDG